MKKIQKIIHVLDLNEKAIAVVRQCYSSSKISLHTMYMTGKPNYPKKLLSPCHRRNIESIAFDKIAAITESERGKFHSLLGQKNPDTCPEGIAAALAKRAI